MQQKYDLITSIEPIPPQISLSFDGIGSVNVVGVGVGGSEHHLEGASYREESKTITNIK